MDKLPISGQQDFGKLAMENLADPAKAEKMKNRIKELRERQGMTLATLAKLSGTNDPSTIHKLETGQRRLTDKWIERISGALGCSPAELIGDGVPMRRIVVHGAVQAGHWNEALEWPDEDRYNISVPIDPKYAGYPQFGLEVHGPSMNRRYPEGAVLVCIRLADMPVEPKEGRRYIVQRIRPDGSYEATVKEYSTVPDGVPRLWPRSHHPNHQSPIPLTGTSGETIALHAIVIGSYIPEID